MSNDDLKVKREHEKYLFLRIYSMDFDGVKYSLLALEKVQEKDIRYRLLREIAVSYARPFSTNRGKLIPKDQCPERLVPKKHMGLHRELLKLRFELFAHSDLNRYDPVIGRGWKGKVRWVYPMSFRGFNYEHLDKQVPDIRKLVRGVTDALQIEIEAYEAKLDKSRAG